MKRVLGILIAAGLFAGMASAQTYEVTWSNVPPGDVKFFEDYLNTAPGAGGNVHSAASVGMEIWAGDGTDLSDPPVDPGTGLINLSQNPGLNNQVAARSANSKPSVLLHNNATAISRVDDEFLFCGWGPYGEANSFLVQIGTNWYISDALPAGEYGLTSGVSDYNEPGIMEGYSTIDTVWHLFHEGDFGVAGFSNMIPSGVGTALPSGDIENTGMLQNGANSSYIRAYGVIPFTAPGNAYYVAATPTDWTDPAAWSDGLAATNVNNYYATNSVVLNTPDTTATFPGLTLTLVGPQRMEVMASGTEVITIDDLTMDGADLGAGVVDAAEARIDGLITVDSSSTFSGATDQSRDLRMLAKVVGGDGVTLDLSAPSRTIYIDNSGNDFSGTWRILGGTAEFSGADMAGLADMQVSNGTLRIQGDWLGLQKGMSLAVEDSATAEVDVGIYKWTVASLTIGSSNVVKGVVYTMAELNAIGDAVFSGAGTIQVGALPPPPPGDLIAGWDTWDSTTAPAATFTAADITASATASAASGGWLNTDNATDPGRGSSKDTTWGTFDGAGVPASSVTDIGPANFTLPNAVTDGEVTFTISNDGETDIDLGLFHFDGLAFRPKAARTYQLNVLAGSDITVGTVFTSDPQAITHLAGVLKTDDADPETHDQHDDLDIDMTGLADHTLEAGGTAIIQLAFSGGAGDGSGGHHLFLDNVGISEAADLGPPDSPVMMIETSGTNVIVTWSSDATFQLQTRTSLVSGDDWTDYPGGDSSPATVPATKAAEFMRLLWQE